jgi:hypothetical protein
METMIHRNPTDSDTISGSTLSSAQARVVVALAQGLSVTAAARQAGVHRDTIYQWLTNQPEFEAAVENARAEYAAILADGLRDLAARALETLRELLDDPKTPHAIRLKTALAILQRPAFPKQGWQLPERIETPSQQQVQDAFSEIEADAREARAAARREPCQPGPNRVAPIAQREAKSPARCAPCPCGSGRKYKRCCGIAA